MTLRELPIGGHAVILAVGGKGALRQHFLDMGLIPGAQVKLVKYAPLGDPMELRINGYALTLRLADAAKITVAQTDGLDEPVATLADDTSVRSVNPVAHPGFGETGKFHDKKQECLIPFRAIALSLVAMPSTMPAPTSAPQVPSIFPIPEPKELPRLRAISSSIPMTSAYVQITAWAQLCVPHISFSAAICFLLSISDY